MTSISNELIYEVLKKLQDNVAQLSAGQHEIRSELRAMRGHLNAIHGDLANHSERMDRIDARLERVEKRLELQ